MPKRKSGLPFKKNGVKFGRPKQPITDEFKAVYRQCKDGKTTAVEAMKRCGMKPNTFYRHVKEYESQK
jgi:hypothetical protein